MPMKPVTNTFVVVAPDSRARKGLVPPVKPDKLTVAAVQYELLSKKPYSLTLEDLILETHVRRLGLSKSEAESRLPEIKAELFSKSHPCMRASPLPKTYGWGVHHDEQGRIALHGVESAEYQMFASGAMTEVNVVQAMRSKRDR